MRTRTLWAVAGLAVLLAGCGQAVPGGGQISPLPAARPSDASTDGLVNPSSIPITFNPLALGNSVPTGIVLNGEEVVLYFWGSPNEQPFLADAWRDRATGVVSDRPPATDYLEVEARPFERTVCGTAATVHIRRNRD